jgi:hypothetical protein
MTLLQDLEKRLKVLRERNALLLRSGFRARADRKEYDTNDKVIRDLEANIAKLRALTGEAV